MGRKFVHYPEPPYYHCKICNTPIAPSKELLSRNFQARSGEAYFFNYCYNTDDDSEEEEKQMITGRYTIRKIYCRCLQEIGWRYIKSFQQDQKFKEDKVIIEKAFIREIFK